MKIEALFGIPQNLEFDMYKRVLYEEPTTGGKDDDDYYYYFPFFVKFLWS